ncbi:MAG: BlaI/MecI/CopY family transcriptional regulator [Archangium sp.]
MDEMDLSRRERQIMDVIWRLGQATVAEVLENLEDPPSYSSIRALMGILKQKGVVEIEQQGAAYVYRPTAARSRASKNALERVVETFFGGEPRAAIAALAELPESKLSKSDLETLQKLIEKSKKEGR